MSSHLDYAIIKICEKNAVFETSTGKIIAKIQRKDGIFHKWYFYDLTRDWYPNISDELRRACYNKSQPTYTKPNDEGIIISTDEC